MKSDMTDIEKDYTMAEVARKGSKLRRKLELHDRINGRDFRPERCAGIVVSIMALEDISTYLLDINDFVKLKGKNGTINVMEMKDYLERLDKSIEAELKYLKSEI